MTYSSLTQLIDVLMHGEAHRDVINCLIHMPVGASYDDVARLFRDRLSEARQADVLNALLTCDDDECLTDEQSELGMNMFEACVNVFGESVVELAQNA